MTRKLFIIATALLLGILCSCSVDDPLPVAPVLEDGEMTGGVHGANRLGGNGVADIVVNGKIAGHGAALICKSSQYLK